MKISTRSRYGLRALVDLASHNRDCANIKGIAERQGLSEFYLEQIFSTLKKAGIIDSIRGAKGGYFLKVPPEDISIGDVLRVLEGSLSPVPCIENDDNTCGSSNCEDCSTKEVWKKIYQSINDAVDDMTLQDLLN